MDGNKDESEHCVSIAQKYINEGDRSKALKFLYKAEKLYPSQRAKGESYNFSTFAYFRKKTVSVVWKFTFFSV